MKYSFTIKETRSINIQRICDENKGCTHILITSPKVEGALLLLSNEFLRRFSNGDGLRIAGHVLPDYGYERTHEIVNGRSGYIWCITGTILNGWQSRVLSADALCDAFKDIGAAMNFSRSIKINVSVG